jgi:hypothetical protein
MFTFIFYTWAYPTHNNLTKMARSNKELNATSDKKTEAHDKKQAYMASRTSRLGETMSTACCIVATQVQSNAIFVGHPTSRKCMSMVS